jgi:hypothetical protein
MLTELVSIYGYNIGNGGQNWLLGLVGAVIALLIYFLPTLISLARRTVHPLGIFLVNLFLGWSIIFWLIALVWAIVDRRAFAEYRDRAIRPNVAD